MMRICLFIALYLTTVAWSSQPVSPIAGKRFLSLDELPSGKKPDGTVILKYWEIEFKDATFRWRSKVAAGGGYEFDAKTGDLVIKGNDKLKASFDANTGILTWDKQKYKITKNDK